MKQQKNFYEKKAWRQNHLVCGVDEVGRGCLAGPLVVGAAILTTPVCSTLLKDSKILTEQERIKAFNWLCKNSIFATAIVPVQTIDQQNIYQATLFGMRRACIQLFLRLKNLELVEYILVDAMPLKFSRPIENLNAQIEHFPFGESRSVSIAAASIVAKVIRDRMMVQHEKHFPGFSFAEHKGYGTAKHYQEINLKEAATPSGSGTVSLIHRATFLTKHRKLKERDAVQTSLSL